MELYKGILRVQTIAHVGSGECSFLAQIEVQWPGDSGGP